MSQWPAAPEGISRTRDAQQLVLPNLEGIILAQTFPQLACDGLVSRDKDVPDLALLVVKWPETGIVRPSLPGSVAIRNPRRGAPNPGLHPRIQMVVMGCDSKGLGNTPLAPAIAQARRNTRPLSSKHPPRQVPLRAGKPGMDGVSARCKRSNRCTRCHVESCRSVLLSTAMSV